MNFNSKIDLLQLMKQPTLVPKQNYNQDLFRKAAL